MINRTPSMTQPKEKTREQWVKQFDKMLLDAKSSGDADELALMLELVRNADKTNNVHYFDDSITDMELEKLWTVNEQMLKLKEQVRVLSKLNDPVLIVGETGTGKELIAHAMHGPREGDFIEVNCAGLPEHLIESELFGHVKGAFTGAASEKIGLFEMADKGTLFLDEIGELPLMLQAKLLRILQDKRIRKVGSNDYKAVDFRLVAATHCDISNLVSVNKFRLDLYKRISTFELTTIPLNQRPEDAKLIVNILEPTFPLDAFDWSDYLTRHKGNVRDLQQLVRRFQVFGTVNHLS